ncbi:MAG TPA: phage portal protein [Microbacterium sp.]|nr:phage portal protein [Microbacterium sp.]
MDDYRVAAVREIREHASEYATAYAYDEGTRAEIFAHPVIARALAKAGVRFNINIARRPIDAVMDRLDIAAVTVVEDEPAENGEPTPDTPGSTATDVLQEQVFTANELDLELPMAIRKSLAYGDGYLLVWPGEDDGTVDVFFEAPTHSRLFYDPEYPRRKMFFAKCWHEDERIRLTCYFPDRIERWVTRPKSNGDRPADFLPYADDPEDDGADDAHIVPNPYGVVPVFHLRPNDRPYGRPEHFDVFGAQDAITKLLATMMDTVDYHGAPQRYALTGRRDTGNVSDIFDDDEDDDTVAPRSDVSNLKSGPGELWLLRNVDAIGQLDPGDVDAFLKPATFYLRMASAITATPMRYFEATGVMPSGQAQRADEAPLLKKCERHEANFGGVISDASEFAMRVLGYDVEVSVRWAPGQSIDDLEGWQTANEKIKAGVPVRQALLEAGYTAEQVDGWLYDHNEDDMRRRIEVLVQLGQAVQSLGSGVALGVLTAQNVSDVIASVMPDTGEDELMTS